MCNADESEPGTCKDRLLLYWDPHLLIEGMIIAAHALHAVHNYIYIRGEMMREYAVLAKAVEDAYAARLPRQEHLRHADRVPPHRAPRRRRVYLRRRDRAAQLARRPARPAAPQAAVPRGQGPVRQPDDRQQRRDPDERAVHHRQGRRVVQRARHGPLGRHAHRVRVGPRREARRVRAADGHHVPRRSSTRCAAASGRVARSRP